MQGDKLEMAGKAFFPAGAKKFDAKLPSGIAGAPYTLGHVSGCENFIISAAGVLRELTAERFAFDAHRTKLLLELAVLSFEHYKGVGGDVVGCAIMGAHLVRSLLGPENDRSFGARFFTNLN